MHTMGATKQEHYKTLNLKYNENHKARTQHNPDNKIQWEPQNKNTT